LKLFDKIEAQQYYTDQLTLCQRDFFIDKFAKVFANKSIGYIMVWPEGALKPSLDKASRDFEDILIILRSHIYKRDISRLSKPELERILKRLSLAEGSKDRTYLKRSMANLYLTLVFDFKDLTNAPKIKGIFNLFGFNSAPLAAR
jgi:hypothetical protein